MKNQTASRSDHRFARWANLAAALFTMAGTASTTFAASQTWTNAPVDATWTNINNWIAKAVPGGLNMTGNTVNNDVATFNAPIPFSGIGGEANPILTDDATSVNRARQIGGITFDTADCGAYVISNATSPTPTSSNGVLYVSQNGAIQLTAAVTNSQRIMVTLLSRSTSSTDGVYNFINNAVSSLSTLYINAATSNIGTTRGTRWILGGSNTGTNTVAAISRGNNGSATAQGIRKQGTGIWILSGPNEMNASAGSSIQVNEGTLIVRDPGSLGVAATTVTTNAVLQIDAITPNQLTMNLTRNGTIRMNGTAALNGVAVDATVVGISPTLATTSASDVFTVGTALAAGALVTGGAADSVLNTAGPGTLVFGQGNTYVGKWNFAAKTNQISNGGALGTGANANVAAGAILDLTPMGATTFTPTTAGLGGSGNGTTVGSTAATVIADSSATVDLSGKAVNLTFTPTSASGDTTHPSLYLAQGTLALSGNTFFVNNASGSALGVGTYRLMQQASGNVTSGGGYAVIVSGSGLAGGTSAEIQVTGGNVDLVVDIYVPKNLVWTGGNPDTIWNVNGSANFLNGASPSVFKNSDHVTFNSIGSTNPTVSLAGTLAPGSVTVDTGANDYTFDSSGSIAGTTALTKTGTGTLVLQTVNTHAGGTTVSNGTLRVAANNAISSTGNGDVAVYGSGLIDLNGFNNSINGLIGNGAVDNIAGGAVVLTLGNNDKGGIFSGVLKNTAGTLGLSKIGTNVQVLSASNSYSGPTTISGGTLATVNANALGVNSDVAINTGGTLDLRGPQLFVNSLTGTGGTIANNTTATTNRIIITGSSTTTWSGLMSDGTGGGGTALTVLGGSFTIGANNTHSGGTIVASGVTFGINNSPAGVTGPLVASNNATLSLLQGSGTPGTPTSITTVDGATVTFTAGALGKIWTGQFIGGANSTNRITTTMSFGGDSSFKDFHGVVRFEAAAEERFINIPTGAYGGSDNTIFEWVGAARVETRDPATVRLGHIIGGEAGGGIEAATAGGTDTFILGGKGLNSTFHGFVRGPNNIVKHGAGSLGLDGRMNWTNLVTLPDSSSVECVLFSNAVYYVGTTTVSNGTLKVIAPNNLTNSPSITLAGAGAVLDVTAIGYATNQTTLDINSLEQPTNTVVVTTGTLQILTNQTLRGSGAILGNVQADAFSTVSPGLSVGTLSVSGSVLLNGIVTMELNRSGAPNSDRISAPSINVTGATIDVTNIGPDCVTGDVYQLFSTAVSGTPAAVNLPLQNAAATVTYVWTNKLAIDGTIGVLSGAAPVNPNPTNLTSSVSGNQLTLSWPEDYKGWDLQTNAVDVANTNFWFTYPGSTGTNQVTLTLDPTKPKVFYRLHLTP